MRLYPLIAALGLLAPTTGCEQVQAALGQKPPEAPAEKAEPKRHTKTDESATKSDDGPSEKGDAPSGGKRDPESSAGKGESPDDDFAVPFAWEHSPEDPLGKARAFFREMTADNERYTGASGELFPQWADAETPRATVLTCSDSRVQVQAWDETPENDDYTVRNLGNQVDNALGSVEYGVERLGTPVLLVLGHTGCTAVKAALDGTGKLDDAMKKELAGIQVSKHAAKGDALRDAVLENVHAQVKAALSHFGRRVHSGKLTVVGAVFDFRNELGRGAGKLVIIDVNGSRDEKKLEAFGTAISGAESAEGTEEKSPEAEERKKSLLSQLSEVKGLALPPAAEAPAEHPPEPPHEAHE
ncbi:MAG TPA: carbonic anhydrase [Polyangiaceae bacterium]|nr:carbonic anhydrase [Polyangiaceae bacterium]